MIESDADSGAPGSRLSPVNPAVGKQSGSILVDRRAAWRRRITFGLAVTTVCGIGVTVYVTDDGPARDVAAVKNAVPRMIEMELDAMAMPASPSERAATATQRSAEATRVVEQVWAPEAAPARRADLLEALDFGEAEEAHESYRDARFVVTDWEKVRVRGDRARVVLLGYDEFLGHGDSRWSGSGPTERIYAELRRTGGGVNGWQLVSKTFDLIGSY